MCSNLFRKQNIIRKQTKLQNKKVFHIFITRAGYVKN
jgi:hypothetical protein